MYFAWAEQTREWFLIRRNLARMVVQSKGGISRERIAIGQSERLITGSSQDGYLASGLASPWWAEGGFYYLTVDREGR